MVSVTVATEQQYQGCTKLILKVYCRVGDV